MKRKPLKHFIWIGLLGVSLSGCGAEPVVGPQGEPGKDGVSIVSVALTSPSENIDTYTIYSDDHTSNFKVTNGVDGESIQGEPGKDGHTPNITISEDGYWVIDDVIIDKGDDHITVEMRKQNGSIKLVPGISGLCADKWAY